ncbi:MAG: dienelactone hydrolase family protein [Anaerolineales bacterium]|nr:dienelactone hydrolase family protein [Anaerolineales bacterium]
MKTIKRLFLTVCLILLALILFFPLSIFVDSLIGKDRIKNLANTVISSQDNLPDVYAYVAKPQGDGPFPVVIMIHEFYGLNEKLISKADLLAEQGYYVIAPDTFRGASTAWIPRAIYQVINTDQAQVNQDLDKVYAWVQSQPEADMKRVGILGFCYGGRVSLLYSLYNPNMAATVIFYGSSETNPEVLKNLSGPVLGIFGEADASIPLEEVTALENGLEQAGIPHQISIYENQPHAFMVDADGIKAGGAQGEAWNEMLLFLDENLKSKSFSPTKNSFTYNAPFPWDYYAMLVFEHAFGSASHH